MNPTIRLPALLVAASLALFVLPSRADAAKPAVPTSFYGTLLAHRPDVPAMTALGRALFFDPRLSASGSMSCASCHSPAHAYGPPNGLAVQLGGRDGKLQGGRAVPSIRYVQGVPSFTEHFFEGGDDGNDSEDQGPVGGHTWDGRAQSVHEQARLPLLSPLEMANPSPADVVDKLRRAGYVEQLGKVFGKDVIANDTQVFNGALLALEVFQQSPAEFYPYSSKYDAYLHGQAKLSAQEARGLSVFNDANKGNCASCHVSAMKQGVLPAFSDWGFIALGVPRNPGIAANRDKAYYDLGLCGPERKDLSSKPEYCGLFRTPSLRNVATRKAFFHNGSFHSLEDVVAFYATRDTAPQRWYHRDAHGKVLKYDDLPARYQDNVNTDGPFGGKVGAKPSMTPAEIKDVVAFLKTLNDGYVPPGAGKAAQAAAHR